VTTSPTIDLKRGDIVRFKKSVSKKGWTGGTKWNEVIAIYTGEDGKGDSFQFRFIGSGPEEWNHKAGFNLNRNEHDQVKVIAHANDIPND
jgi:hypothetical protein